MNKQEKSLLLKDFCARLPYDVQAEGKYEEEAGYGRPYGGLEKSIGHVEGIDHIGFDDGEIYVTIEGIPCELSDVKPYLRPMSSMTEEEKFNYVANIKEEPCVEELPIQPRIPSVDYLNSHHFDYRNLISKGLALEAPEGLYPIKI